MLVMVAFGCSKDHDAPTFATYDGIEKPTNVNATYDKATDSVVVSWNMIDSQDIVQYYITRSDSSLFDFGKKRFYLSDGTNKTYSISASFVPADVDSVIYYFDVSAIYDNATNYNSLIGPRSDEPDSALILRK
jgi:hypothetical protein